jgi:hypothetical protein
MVMEGGSTLTFWSVAMGWDGDGDEEKRFLLCMVPLAKLWVTSATTSFYLVLFGKKEEKNGIFLYFRYWTAAAIKIIIKANKSNKIIVQLPIGKFI